MSDEAWYFPSIETHSVASREIGQTYQIHVMQPLTRRAERERFPVLYLTDSNTSFEFAKSIASNLQAAGQVNRFILVGIGYPGDNPLVGSLLRWRDFTSERRPRIPGYPPVPDIEGVSAIPPGAKSWGGAMDFLSFIRQELVPFIDATYPTISGECAYAGHSLGGGFGLSALFARSSSFNRYIIASPSVAHDDDDYGIREAQEFVASNKAVNARVFLAVGDQEEFDSSSAVARPRFVSSFYRLVSVLAAARIPGLELSHKVFAGETHASVWPIAFSHGIRTVYGCPQRPPA